MEFFKTRSAKASPLPAEIRRFSSSDCIETSPLSEVRFSHLWIGPALILPRLTVAEKMPENKNAPGGLVAALRGLALCTDIFTPIHNVIQFRSDWDSQAEPFAAAVRAA